MLQKNEKVGIFEKLIYGSGQIGLNALYTLFSAYVLMFYTDVMGINPTSIGIVILISKIFDGFSDLVAGQIIDTHKSRHGHCIPVLLRWTVPMVASVVLVFMVPHTVPMIQLIFIFVTYNLFNTIFYTLLCMAHGSLPSYATGDALDRSQMLVCSMLFAAAMQTILASAILPMVNFFGGQNLQSAWIKSTLVFGVLGIFFLYLNVLFVKERVENDAPPENIVAGVKVAFQNKYWIMTLLMNICNNMILIFNLSVSVYYLGNVAGNLGLMGAYVAVSNVPGVFLMMIVPGLLGKISKQKMVLFGALLMLGGQIAFILGPADNVTWLLGTGLVRGIGFGFPMGLGGAMIGDCIDYGEWKTGIRVQSVLFSANSVGQKIGQGVLTSLFGFFLTSIGYDGLKEVQEASTIAGIDRFFKYVPIAAFVMLFIITYFFDLEKKLPQIQKELAKRLNA